MVNDWEKESSKKTGLGEEDENEYNTIVNNKCVDTIQQQYLIPIQKNER